MESIREMMQAGQRRLMLNLNDVRHFNPEMAQSLLSGPAGFLSLSNKLKLIDDNLPEFLPDCCTFHHYFSLHSLPLQSASLPLRLHSKMSS